jgi:prephenate dehydrogenase
MFVPISGSMNFNNITIIGVGLIGSSFALALKERGFEGRITGVGRREEYLAKAKEKGIIDLYTTAYEEGVKDADLIVLASPVGQFEQIINKIGSSIKKGAIVTDVGSVKADIIKKVEPMMPEGVSFVGGHPIAGKEYSGFDAATPDLFKNVKFIITPTTRTDKNAQARVAALWESVEARIVLMSPEEHDRIFAAVSHLPHVVAYALVNSIMDMKGDILENGGKGLKDVTRIALSPTEIWRDICALNRKEILESLKIFSSSLSGMIELIEASDWNGLEKEFARAKEARQSIESN